MRKLLALCLFMALTASSLSVHALQWQVDVKAGIWQSDLDEWSKFYGRSYTPTGNASVALRLLNFVELGMRGGYLRDKGTGQFASSSAVGGEVTHHQLSGELFGLLVAQFARGQWIVPYAGGGYGRTFYRQTVTYQDAIMGGQNGLSYIAGVRFLMNGFDKRSARTLDEDFGAFNSYFTLEYVLSDVETQGVSLGGGYFMSGVSLSFH